MDDGTFLKLVEAGIEAIPEPFRHKLNTVAIVIADEPSAEQLESVGLTSGDQLFGLYEGVPQTERGIIDEPLLPDKITIFKCAILAFSDDPEIIKQEVADTVYHEIGHYFGLDEAAIEAREAARLRERRKR